MSSQQEKRNEKAKTEESDNEDQQQPQQLQKDENPTPAATATTTTTTTGAKKPTAAKKGENGWGPELVFRGAGADVANYKPDVFNNIVPGLQQMLSLPTLDPSLHHFDLVQSRFKNDLQGSLTEVYEYLRDNVDPFTKGEFPNFFGSCQCQDSLTPARFSIYTYVDQGQVVFYLRQFDGCGIAFSRFFKSFNQQFGIDPEMKLHTFEQPPTTPLSDAQLSELEARFSKVNLDNDDVNGAQVEHPISWAVDTIKSLRESIITNAKLNAQDLDDDVFAQHQLVINFSTASTVGARNDQDEEVPAEPLPLTNEAQSRMLDQAFSALNGTLAGVIAHPEAALSDAELTKLGEFFEYLCELEPNAQSTAQDAPMVPKFYAFCQHPMIEVTVAAVTFIANAIGAGVMGQVSIEVLAPLFLDIYTHSHTILERCNPELTEDNKRLVLSPFEKIGHEKICYTISQLQQPQ